MFTSRKVQRQLLFTNIGPGSSRSMLMWWYVCSLHSVPKGHSCLVDQVCILSWLCPTPYALCLMLARICGREQPLEYNCSTMVHFVVLTFPKPMMSLSGYGCILSLLPITTFQRNSAWISLSKMVIRTTINKAANNQTQKMKIAGKLPSLALNDCILESKGISSLAIAGK